LNLNNIIRPCRRPKPLFIPDYGRQFSIHG